MSGSRPDRRRVLVLAAASLLSLAAFWPALTARVYVQDDAALVGSNALLDAGASGLPMLLTSGYWESVDGRASRVHEYRPLLMLSFLAQRAVSGPAAPPLHAANVLLHLLACGLVFEVLRRRLDRDAAAAGTLAFAVMPTHVEAVAALTGRSEVLAAVLLLGAWLCLDAPVSRRRLAAGAGLFAAALLTKEHALLFPVFLALADWAYGGVLPWSRGRRPVHASLLAVVAAYLVLRLSFLDIPFGGGVPYFGDRLTAALTVSRFAFGRYLWPSLTGLGLCTDFARPLISDALPGAASSWPPLLALAGLYAYAVLRLLKDRARWAFWLCGCSLFLLPTAHVIAPLDTIGAQRFLYLPSVGLAAGLGALWSRARAARPRAAAAAGAALLAWQAWSCAAFASTWRTGLGYYEAALSCNPASARSRAAHGTQLILAGRSREGRAELEAAIRSEPSAAAPYYNLARDAWGRGDVAACDDLVRRSLARDAGSPDALLLASLTAHARGREADEESFLRRALAAVPWHPAANMNYARFELLHGKPAESIPYWRAFAHYAPDDPDAPRAAALADRLEAQAASAAPKK